MNPWWYGYFGNLLPDRVVTRINSFDSNPYAKRTRSHIGDCTAPKAKMSKHRKSIKKMENAHKNGWVHW